MILYAPPISDLNQIVTRNHAELSLLSANDHPQYGLLTGSNTWSNTNDFGDQNVKSTYVPLLGGDLVNKTYADAATSKLLDQSTTPVNYINATVETTLYTYSLPANKLGTVNGIRITLNNFQYYNIGANTLTLRFKLNGVTIMTDTYTTGAFGSTPGQVVIVVLEKGVSNSQWCTLQRACTTPSSTNGTATATTTSAITVAITGASNNNGSYAISWDSLTTEWLS